MGGGGYGSGCGQKRGWGLRLWVVVVGFCSGFWWAVTVGWVSVGLAMSFGGGWWQWVGLGFTVGFSLFHSGFRWISVCFVVGFGA